MNVNNYIGAEYTSETPIDFDWYNPHPYQRTTRIIKKILTQPFFVYHIKALVEVSMNVWKRE